MIVRPARSRSNIRDVALSARAGAERGAPITFGPLAPVVPGPRMGLSLPRRRVFYSLFAREKTNFAEETKKLRRDVASAHDPKGQSSLDFRRPGSRLAGRNFSAPHPHMQ